MTYILYYAPGSASLCVHWMLVHLAADFELSPVEINAGGQDDPTYRALNPAGRVPTLVIEGKPYGESAALLMLLAERHPEAGSPRSARRAGPSGWSR